MTVFHLAKNSYKEVIFQDIFNCAKKNLTREKLNRLFVATDNGGRTVFIVAAGFQKIGIFQ